MMENDGGDEILMNVRDARRIDHSLCREGPGWGMRYQLHSSP